ncbi:MAG: HEPN domain-containing protein [Candidatus Eremiobacteraeota bacterium]|nr:HEPN domain-containing protein [Candidatus Eremiobacteraeota bacterium]
MAISNEAELVWQKALRKLGEATQMPPKSFPGIVIVSSYFAMRHAAVAALLKKDGKAPSAETEIIARFGVVVGTEGAEHGRAFNSVFDLRNAEDYDAVETPSSDEAAGACSAAKAFIAYCSQTFGFPLAAQSL